MKTRITNQMTRRGMRSGAALMLAMIFMITFSIMALGMMSMATANAQVAFNQHKGNGALLCAESGASVLRYWLDTVSLSDTIPEDDRFGFLAAGLQENLTNNYITNITFSYDGDSVVIDDVALDSSGERTFSAILTPDPSNNNYVQMTITGVNGSIDRKLSLVYSFETKRHTVFDFGIATKGPLYLAGNAVLEGLSDPDEANVYIETYSVDEVLNLSGTTSIGGDVSTTNPDGTLKVAGKAGIGGATGSDAYNNFDTGVAPVAFPEPNPKHFEQYVDEEDVVDSSTELSSYEGEFTNVRIKAGTNPSFESDTVINGVLFIESPNNVRFAGQVTINGIVVGDGDVNDNSGTNTLVFEGGVETSSVAGLDEEEYGDLTKETGTFLMAPGFSVAMGGGFASLNGTIAANGITFYGNAGGVIAGSVLNYSDKPLTIETKDTLTFDHSASIEFPAGFIPETGVYYRPEFYSELVN